jgi:hypothetical protein
MLNKICYLLIFLTVNTLAQKTGNMELNAGFGFYDAFKTGITCHFRPHMSVGISIGFDNHILRNEKYFSANAEFMLSILRRLKTDNDNYRCWIHNRMYFWWLDDRFYQFGVIAYSPCFVYRIDLSERVNITCSAGPAINFVVYNYRKTFEEVGWPHYVQFNPGIQLNYILNK